MAENNTIDPTTVRSFADMAQLLRSEMDRMPTNEYMEQKIGKIDRRTRKNEEAIVQLRNTVAELGRQAEEARSRPDERNSDSNLTKFKMAFRTIHIWPIMGKTETDLSAAVDEFIASALLVEQVGDQRIIYSSIERVPSLPRSRQHNEVRVIFKEPHMRDIVLSYARNLQTYIGDD